MSDLVSPHDHLIHVESAAPGDTEAARRREWHDGHRCFSESRALNEAQIPVPGFSQPQRHS